MEGFERKSYSAAVIEGEKKRARVFVGDSIVRKTDRVLNKGDDVVVCLPGAKIEAITEWIDNIVGSIPFTPGYGPFVICDYGTADGVNSLGVMTNCIDWVQKTYGEDQQVHVVYEDRPNNDFNSLIRYIEDETAGSNSYLQDHKNIFVTCCGRSFYKQCLPDATVHLGFSTSAVAWFSDLPSVTSKEVFYLHFAEGSDEKRLFKVQAARDWDNFLFYRSKELVPGGRLVTTTISDSSCSCAKTGTKVWCWMKKMTDQWREMMHEKIISEDEFFATVEPNIYRTAEEIHVPFNDNSRVNSSGLRIVDMETHSFKCAWRESWLISNKPDDSAAARSHAVSFVQSARTCTNRIFVTGLSKERNVKGRERILDEFYSRLVDQVAMAPADWGIDAAVYFVTAAKTG
ncbi:hypothetical protein LSAT2_021635 [Lamellibrachia satsuma]|nr:hypothetical protein LSAT2_021635 [Lamellibrachia satsuma]